MRYLALALALAALPCPAVAQVAAVGSTTTPRAIVKPTARITAKVALLIDSSGSMGHGRDARALRAALLIAGQPTDELAARITCWSDRYEVWEGHEPTTPQWTDLPSADAIVAAGAWVASHAPGGGTDPRAALEDALRQRVKGLSVVLITDGEWGAELDVAGVVEDLQAWRCEQGLGRAVVAVYGVGPTTSACAALIELGTLGGGGLWADALR